MQEESRVVAKEDKQDADCAVSRSAEAVVQDND